MIILKAGLGRKLAAAFSGCLIVLSAWAQSLEVIELRHRTAQQVIPVLQPLLESGGALTGQDQHLFVRTSAANLAQIRAALQQIDRPARQLRVSVRQGGQSEEAQRAASASGVWRTDGPSSVGVRGSQSRSTADRRHESHVLVLEGGAALITTGASMPFVTAVLAGAGRRGQLGGAATTFREVQSGFLVTPRVTGDAVVLDIEQQNEALERGQINTQRLTTQVRARLGEWMQLGGVIESGSQRASGVASREQRTTSADTTLWVKVEDASGQ